MKVLLCFDCDGTLYTLESLIPPQRVSQSPIPLERLNTLAAAGAQVVIVSPSDACEGLSFHRIIRPERLEALREAARWFPADLYIYVSDNLGDDLVARQAGFSYLHPDHFR